jgi:hypothetical protein
LIIKNFVDAVHACPDKSKKLKKATFKAEVVSELRDILYFISNPFRENNHFYFENGCYDTALKILRDTTPFDYNAVCACKYEKNPFYIKQVQTFLEEVIPDPLERQDLLFKLSDVIFNKNNKHLLIFHGHGYGKSALINLLKHTLGDYFGDRISTLEIEIIKGKMTGSLLKPMTYIIECTTLPDELKEQQRVSYYHFSNNSDSKNTIYESIPLWKTSFMKILFDICRE